MFALVERVGAELSFAEHEESLVVRDAVRAVLCAFSANASEIDSFSCSPSFLVSVERRGWKGDAPNR